MHLNPKLCPHRIDHLKTYAQVADWDEREVSNHTNGDKEACNTAKLNVQFVSSSAKLALIKLANFALVMDDPRSLLYYLVNYREVPNGTVTMFDGRDGCNSQNDVWYTIEEPPQKDNTTDTTQHILIQIKPATRYALYVKTYTILEGSMGALSDMIYFETAPDTPGMPRQIESLADAHDTVKLQWLPPSKPNGVIERYYITISKINELEDLQNLDVCDSISDRDRLTKTLTSTEPDQPLALRPPPPNSSINSSTTNENSNSCAKHNDPEIEADALTFQDLIIDIVYLKQPCPITGPNKTVKRKRSAYYDSIEDESAPNSVLAQVRGTVSKKPISTESRDNSIQDRRSSPLRSIRFDRTRDKTEANVTASDSKLSYLITNLEHFSLYSIEVVACHGDSVANKTKLSKTYSRCGLQAITQIRTKAIADNDKISKSNITFNPANETESEFSVSWAPPERPNGLVLGYRVRYRMKNGNSDVWTEGCINSTTYNQTNSFKLTGINPGSYLLSVQTVSMYSERFWSEEIEFEIPQNLWQSPTALVIMIIVILFTVVASVAGATYIYQKKQHELVYASVNPDYIQYDPDEWEVDKSNLIIGAQIGTGSFGMVYKGQMVTEKGTLPCAVKTVPPTSTAKQRMDFLREASIMKQFDTFHVVKLMGVVSSTTPVYVVMEYMENGDLKDFLRSQREIHQRENKSIVDGIYLMAAQIADGMAYLASRKFIHRDLAARNCMVGENRVVKIGDFGLTRDVYANDYYRRDTQGRLPVRWMAPESLSDNLYTSASDVWSYGIVVWEMVTFSAYPYQGLSNDEVIKRVIHGSTMPRPENCPDKLFNIMERCWRKNAKDRPTFTDIVEYLLAETEDRLYPNCFYRKPKTGADSIAQSTPEENNTGAESYPLLSWPSNRANGLTNCVNHENQSSEVDGMEHH